MVKSTCSGDRSSTICNQAESVGVSALLNGLIVHISLIPWGTGTSASGQRGNPEGNRSRRISWWSPIERDGWINSGCVFQISTVHPSPALRCWERTHIRITASYRELEPEAPWVGSWKWKSEGVGGVGFIIIRNPWYTNHRCGTNSRPRVARCAINWLSVVAIRRPWGIS